MTIAQLLQYTAERPDDLALIDNGREVRYAAFTRDLWKFARAVQKFGLLPGQSVAIGVDDSYTHWLMLLAFESLGVTTASFHAREGQTGHALLGAVDLVLAEPHYPPGGWATRLVTRDWLNAVQAAPDEGPVAGPAPRPTDALRIVRTSGTTGEPKRYLLRRSLLDAKMNNMRFLYPGDVVGSRRLTPLPWSIGGTYMSATLALRQGAVLVIERQLDMAELPALVRRYGVARLTLLPVQMKQVLERLPDDWTMPPDLEINSIGAAVPEKLRAAVTARFAPRLNEIYASNEAGVVAVIREAGSEGFGLILPNVEVEIVDEADLPVPDGSLGQIRIRSSSVFEGYLDDRTLTRRMLRDGWFYPGDIGVRQGPLLQMIGRVDDQVNLGGSKYALNKLETAVQTAGGASVKEVGMVVVPGQAGLPKLVVGVVMEGEADRAALDRMVGALQLIVPADLNFVRLPAIPRNEAGKIDRARLAEAAAAARRGEGIS